MSKIQEALQKSNREKQGVAIDKQSSDDRSAENKPITISDQLDPAALKALLDPHLLTYLEPDGAIADQFRTLRTLLRLNEKTKPLQKIVISSPSQKEGKSTICLNLGIALASESDTKVLVVDTDFRNPSVHKKLGLNFAPGLFDALVKTMTFEQIICETGIPNFAAIPTGKQLSNPTDILNSTAMTDFCTWAASQFDYVLFDAPPVIAVPDTTVIGIHSDGIILVVEAEKTHISSLSRTLELLEKANINVIGLILNKLRTVSSEYRYRYGKS